MIKIEIESAEVKTRSGVAAKTGKPYQMREQKAYAHLTDRDGKPNRYPSAFVILLGDDQPPYAPGVYGVSPASFYTDRFDNLAISVRLVPAAAPVRQAA